MMISFKTKMLILTEYVCQSGSN